MKSSLTCLTVLLMVLGFTSGAGAEPVNVVKINSDVVIEENTKVRNVIVLGGQVTVNGTVEQHIVVIGGSAVLTRTAVVGGDVVALGGIIAVGNGADVRGTITEINSSNISDAISDLLSDNWEGWSWLFAIFSVVVFLATLIIAMLIAVLIPKPILTISEGIALHTYRATITGLIGLLMIAPVAVLLTLSVIGIVLIPLQIIVVACAAVFGFVAVAQILGQRVLVVAKKPDQSLVRQIFWGLLVLWIIGWIPYVGWMMKVLAIVLGMGGVMITRFGAKKV
jgi:MFS family permease